ncbi:DUF4198 domain-containing protein [Noviherbaspirillum aridicola]|uniref:DUF4198 domain-containing protein n=1 Tax=Noviherbaspirillum aridicola TaxID=2849687 RepID=A0ABQ4Q4D3_9BURK|nr:DUF4198 domain-containing protein [Noviherbaspirillum aridicola]GIZ51862.1 hypothetical protein NCCP691_18760 [Noviherbaspirillum aridicola]
MRLALPAALAAAILVSPGAVLADEVWLAPRPFSPAAGSPVEIGLRQGEHFRGNPRAFRAEATAALQLYSKLAVRDLREQLAPEMDVGMLRLTPAYPGTHMVVYDSEPGLAERAAGEFGAWLRDHELEQVTLAREQSGTAGEPARERLRHHAKTLLRVGGKSDGTYGLLTGQRLEIVPTVDPLARRPGDTLVFNLLFDSKPLPGVLVRAWHRDERQTVIVRARTGADGKVALVLPWTGVWMVGAVHMVPAGDIADADWDSFRASLSFELGEDGAAR